MECWPYPGGASQSEAKLKHFSSVRGPMPKNSETGQEVFVG
eukprot:CAMPEP_0195104628 /NCGR_PEP_ID=MMETSP0448-20130528/73216_1 /TAXON_ID=66468 /ORGANISM="Heterocapsa triquestra, Strain CCMP 448" /LENGTH=40 /DNA_ID= /DNA_START= /DNA_END= /DNA_ORIENTATION=